MKYTYMLLLLVFPKIIQLFRVIRRLVVLILCEADLLSENESAMKRAQNATETVEKILKQNQEVLNFL